MNCVYEDVLLGTAGTLRVNAQFFCNSKILLTHAENWCQCDFREFICYHLHSRPAYCSLTMMNFDSNEPTSCGIVETNNQGVVTAFYEKKHNPPGNRANAAVYILEPEVLEWLEHNPSVIDFSTEVLPHYVGRIATWHNKGIHREIGTFPSLRAAQSDPLPDRYWHVQDK